MLTRLEIAKEIKALMKEKGISQTQMASMLGLTPKYVSRMLNLGARLNFKRAHQMYSILGVHRIDIIGL